MVAAASLVILAVKLAARWVAAEAAVEAAAIVAEYLVSALRPGLHTDLA